MRGENGNWFKSMKNEIELNYLQYFRSSHGVVEIDFIVTFIFMMKIPLFATVE